MHHMRHNETTNHAITASPLPSFTHTIPISYSFIMLSVIIHSQAQELLDMPYVLHLVGKKQRAFDGAEKSLGEVMYNLLQVLSCLILAHSSLWTFNVFL